MPGRDTTAAAERPESATTRDAEAPLRASPADLALVERLIAGDEAAFGALVARYHGRLMRLARVFVSDASAAEEVVQDTWLGVINGIASFRGRSALKTWIFRILTNRARTRGARDSRSVTFGALAAAGADDEPGLEPSRFLPSGSWGSPPDRWEEEDPEKLLARKQALELVERSLAELPAAQRAVLTLRDVEGLDASDVCNVLDLSETNQRVLLHRARTKIRRALERELGGV